MLTIANYALMSKIYVASLLWVSWCLVSLEILKDAKHIERLLKGRACHFLYIDEKDGMPLLGRDDRSLVYF